MSVFRKRSVLITAALVPILAIPAFMSLARAQQAPPQTAPQQAPAPPPAPALVGSLNLQDASLVEVIDQLARLLKLNYILDPAVKGGVTINTYGDTSKMDARNLLEMILRINGFGMVQEGEVYRILPVNQLVRQPIPLQLNSRNIPDDDQTMLNLIFLNFVTVDELTKVLAEFTDEHAVIKSYAPANMLFILDSRRNMRRIMDLIQLFDSDAFTGQRVRLFEIDNIRPSDLAKELESILKSISLDNKISIVRFLPIDHIGTLIVVAPNPGVFGTVEDWIKKLDVPITAKTSIVDTYVYRVKYGRADCLAMALNQLFNPQAAAAYSGGYGGGGFTPGYAGAYGSNTYGQPYAAGAYPGGYGGGLTSAGGASGLNGQNSFAGGPGGASACGPYSGGGMAGGAGGGGGGYGYPSFGGYSAQAPSAQILGGVTAPQPNQQAAGANAANGTSPFGSSDNGQNPPQIVANPLDNALIIRADAQQYQSIMKLLKDLDVPPRQILLEAKIYSVSLTGSFSSGVTAYFQKVSGNERTPLANLVGSTLQLSAGGLVSQTKELLAFMNLQESSGNAKIVSEPSLIATDSIPASINVGSQVPVLTGTIVTPGGGTNTTQQGISSHNTGVTLNVNARVNPSGVVTLYINQEVSKPTATTTSNIQTPTFDQQVVQTQITMQDGDTIAIGGIISESTSYGTSGIPGLNRLPGIGILFGSRNYTRDRSELIMFMTPHVIYDNSDLIEASEELKSRVKKLRKYMSE